MSMIYKDKVRHIWDSALLHTMLAIVVTLNILNFAIIIYTEPTIYNINIMWNKFTNNF